MQEVKEYPGEIIENVTYSTSNIYGKIMFTTDNLNRLRVHLFRDLEEIDGENEDIKIGQKVEGIYVFPNLPSDYVVTKIMNLTFDKSENNSAEKKYEKKKKLS